MMKSSDNDAVRKFIGDNEVFLQEAGANTLAALTALQGIDKAPESLDFTLLQFALGCSSYLADVAEQNPESFCRLAGRHSDQLPDRHQLLAGLEEATAEVVDDAQAFSRQLRQFRHLHLALIAFHDLAGISSVESILRCLSDIADVCIARAMAVAESIQQQRFGLPYDEEGQQISLIVVGMGKLGGGELNFSSDVDLIFLYRDHGVTRGGSKELDNQEYFRRVGQLMIKFLDEVTADGFVYRVDMRLRPFGSSGPLVVSLGGLENYLLTQGRDWERYAWIKSRVICGDADDSIAVAELLKPFIYRRYLDFAVFESLRDLKRQIGVKLDRAGTRKDVKLGQGGIREIEFIAQSFQLVRGGQEPALQQRSVRPVIEQLASSGHISKRNGIELIEAYDFLRRAENRLQMAEDRQTHLLPVDEKAKARLAISMCFKSWSAFESALLHHNEIVHELFVSVFSVAESSDETDAFINIWLQIRSNPDADNAGVLQELQQSGLNDANDIFRLLSEFANSGRYQRYLNRSRDLIDKLIPKSLNLIIASEASHSESLQRVLSLFNAIAGRVGYLQLLTDSAATLQNLVRLIAQSPWLATFVTNHPIVLDELLDIELGSSVATVEQNIDALKTQLEYHRDADLGEVMDIVRQFQKLRMVRIAAADINGELPVMKVSDGLSWLAQAVLQIATGIVQADMQDRYGLPQCIVDGKTMSPEFAIVAYGKLGGIELGYGSDLDIVFVHESTGSDQMTDGDKSIENQVYFSRMAQKLVHFISTLTGAGFLYEIDTRLRPNGRSGVLVIGIDAFSEYQRKEAWTWEHQALVRARVVVGSERFSGRFKQIRTDTLMQAPDADRLRADVADMRTRMRNELAQEEDGTFDLKQGLGGIADIEFMVQYLVLKNAGENAALLDFTDNVRQLECLAKYEILDIRDAKALTDAYLCFRGRLHKRALLEDTVTITIDEESTRHRKAISDCWQRLMEIDV